MPDVLIPYVSGPLFGGYWDTIPDLAAANANSFVDIAHTGGTIGCYLGDFGAFSDNQPGSPNPTYSLALTRAPGTILSSVTPDIFSATVSLFGGGANYPSGTYRVQYQAGGMQLQPPSSGISGWTAALYHAVYSAVPPTALLTATPGTLTLCSPGPSVLAWTTTNAAAVSIAGSDGSVYPALSANGSFPVTPNPGVTTYTLTATGPGGTTFSAATVNVTGIISNVTPNVTTGARAFFFGGQPLPAGTYRIYYLSGAYRYEVSRPYAEQPFVVQGHGPLANMGGPLAGFYAGDGASQIFGPGASAKYHTPGDAQAANAGQFVLYTAPGGLPLWMQLSLQALGYPPQGLDAAQGTPAFELYGPVPTASLSSAAPAIPYGASTTLSWETTTGTTISLDNGIGPVAASGTLTVSPLVTTTYTLTCTDGCNPAVFSVTVTVLLPQTPAGFSATASGGQVSLACPPAANAGGYQWNRGTSPGTETPIGTSAGPAFTDTTAAAGTLYFYTVQSASAAGVTPPYLSPASAEVSALVPLAPPQAPLPLLTPLAGKMLVAWPPPAPGAYGSLAAGGGLTVTLSRSTVSGGETVIASGMTGTYFIDPGLTNGQPYFYTLAFVNSAGTGAASPEASATPQASLGWG